MKAPVLESLLDKVAHLHACNFVKKRLQHRCFPAKFARFLRRLFFLNYNTSGGCLLPSEVFRIDFVDIGHENFSCRILEALLWMQLKYFLIIIVF